MNVLVWVVALFVVGLVVMVLEVFVPSGGVLGFLSLVAIGAAIVLAFVEAGAVFGLAVVAVVFVVVPATLAGAFRLFPSTPLGRRVLPPPPTADDVQPGAGRRRQLEALVGRRGRARGELLPWGAVEVGGVAIEARSEAGPIPAETEVVVVCLDGPAVVVRAVNGPPSRPEQPDRAAADGRSRTLEDFDFDGLGPPVT